MKLVSRGAWILWGAFCCAILVVVVSINLDRQAKMDPRLAGLVPDAFRTQSLPAYMSALQQSGDSAGFLKLARKNVVRNPMPAENLSSLTLAASAAGDEALASKAAVASIARGWRDVNAQSFAIQIALAGNQTPIAVQRLAALWMLGGDPDVLMSLSEPVLGHTDGQEGFAQWLVDRPDLRDSFLRLAKQSGVVENWAQTAVIATRDGATFNCPEVVDFVRSMLAAGKSEAAWMVWSDTCGKSGPHQVYSGTLQIPETRWESDQDPYAWEFPMRPGVKFSIRDGQNGLALLEFANRSISDTMIARKYARLSPGAHVLGLAGDSNAKASLRFRCIENGAMAELARVQLAQHPISITVPSDCATQRIDMIVGQGRSPGFSITLDGQAAGAGN